MANKIEIPVSLGLKEATAQAAELRKILEANVQPNTRGYENILSVLNKIGNAASGLKGRLGSAFATSKSSSSFLRDYEKLLTLLETVKSQFSDLGLSEIKISVEDSQKVEDYTKKIAQLQTQIQAVSGGKIGGFFNLEEFKQAKNLLDQLKIDPSKFTFEGLSDKLNNELNKTNGEINNLENQFKNVENVINILGEGKLDGLNDGLKKATENANGLIRKVSDSDTKISINSQLQNLFEALDGVDFKAKFINQDTDIDKFIKEETKRVVEAYDTRIAELNALKPKVDKAITDLKGQSTNKDTLDIINSDAIKNAFKSLDLSAELEKFLKEAAEKGEQGAQDIAVRMAKALNDAVKTDELKGWRDAFVEELPKLFDNATETFISKASTFKNALKDMFTANNINISGIDKVKEAINSIRDGDNATEVLHRLAEAFREYAESAGQDNTEKAAQYQELADKLETIRTALEEVNKAESSSSGSVKEKEEEIKQLQDSINELLKKYKELTGKEINLKVNPGDKELEKGKSAINSYISSLTKLENKQKALSNVQSAVTRWMGFYQVLNLTKRAINDMKQHITELDTVMTKIAVVTNMTTNDLWNQIGTYSEIARQYGVAIKGVYEVSQIYYQQGLNKGDVMGLTTETLKMARIAGIDYATAADYMTTAIRGFKLEMSEAAHVTDVFSALAASTASSTEELATAISKTAASAASVGASFEATSAMMATMIATTRESATNIGTALKSIIARYGELKENITGTDAEGEEYSLNKVDKALQAVGISIHDASGQFRDFDDVILELAKAWDTIDKNTQRYIATVMAGNRQQSRFLALVSNVEEYKRALEIANDAEGSGDIQTLKTLDSIDAKIERMKVTIQEFYTSSGLQDLYKGILDTITNIVSAANSLPKLFGNIPAMALLIGAKIISVIKNVLKLIISQAQMGLEQMKNHTTNIFKRLTGEAGQEGERAGKQYADGWERGAKNLGKNTFKSLASLAGQYLGSALQVVGSVLTLSGLNDYGASTDPDQDRAAGRKTKAGAWASIGGSALSGAAMGAMAGGIGAFVGGIGGFLSGLITNIETLRASEEMLNVSLAREIELKQKEVNVAQTEETTAKGVTNNLQQAFDKLQQLKDASYDSSEAMAEYKEYMNQLADSYPYLVSKIEITGDKTIELADLEEKLAASRVQSALATVNALKAEQEQKALEVKAYSNLSQTLDTALNPEGAGVGSYSYQNFQTLMRRENIKARDPYEYYNQLVEQGKIKGTKIDVGTGWTKIGATESKQYTYQLKQAYQYLSSQSKTDYTGSKDIYINALKDIMAAQPSLSLSDLTGLDYVTSIDQIKGLSTVDLIKAIQHTQERAQEYINAGVAEVHNLDNAIEDAELQLKIESNLSKNILTDTIKYQKYTSLISGLITTEHGIGWAKETDTATVDAEIDKWKEWIVANQEAADWLMTSFDQTNYKSEADLRTILTDKNLPIETIDKYIDNWNQSVNNLNSNLIKILINQIKDSDVQKQLSKVIYTEGKIGKSEGLLLNGQLINILQSKLVKYKSLINQGLTTTAQNYMNSISSTFEALASLSSEQQIAVSPIISSIDFMDIDSIENATEALKDLDPDLYGDLITVLSNASKRLTVNIEAQVLQLRESAKDISKNIEKTLDNLDKGMKLSEAIEQFDELAKDYTGDFELNFDSIYKWDQSLNGYVLSTKGIELWIKKTTSDATNKIEQLSAQLEETTLIYNDLFGNPDINFARLDEDKQRIGIKMVLRQKFSATDEQGNFLVSDEELDAKTDAYMDQYKALTDEFVEARKNGETKSWEEWIKNRSETLEKATETDIEFLQNLPKSLILQKIQTLDYKAIAGGTAASNTRENLEALLLEAGIDPSKLGDEFTSIWTDMLSGNFDSFNQLLSDAQLDISVSDSDAFLALQEEYKQYSEGLSEVLSNKPIAAWSAATKEIAGITSETDLTTIDTGAIALNFLQRIAQLVEFGAATIEDQEQSIINVMNQRDKDANIGRQKQLLDTLKNGFTNEELVKLGGVDNNGNLKEELINLVEKDNNTGDFKIIAKGSAVEILDQFAEALGITLDKNSDAYKEAVSSGIDEGIAERAKNNTGKQIANQIQTLSSAKVGDEVNISLLSSSMKQVLGLSENAEILTIESEERRDALLLLLETSISEYEGAGKEALIATYNNIKSSIVSKKGNKGTQLSNMLNKTINEAAAKEYLTGRYGENAPANTKAWLENVAHYQYDAFNNIFIATEDTLNYWKDQLSWAEGQEGISQDYITELKAKINQISYELQEDPMRNALNNLLSNYQNLTPEILSTFAAQFNIDDMSQYYTEEKGIKKLNVEKLKSDLGEEWSEYFDNVINSIADEYISNAQKAGTLFTQGTTSQVEMSGFKAAYKQLTRAEVEFIFDPLLQAWTMDITNLRTYLSSVAKTMNLSTSDQQSWVDNQIKTLITDNLNFSGYLAGTNTVKENKVLRKNLTDYFKDKSKTKGFLSQDELNEWIKDQVDTIFENLSQGGQEAIDALRSIKGELTQEEIEAAYRAQIKPIKALVDQLNELQIGSIVAKNQIDALNAAGFEVNTDGVIISTGNLVDAYKSLYDQMKATNEATIAELNTALGKYLDSKDGEQVIIDALSNATSMTYSQLAEIYTQAGIELTESMVNELEASGIIKGLGGNKMMIQDFESFAASMGWNADSEEYVKAFKAYNDSLIQLDNATEKAIVEEVNAVLKANPGDKINLTYLANQLHLAAGEIWELEGATLKDGILSIEKGANIGNITNQLIALARSSTENIEEELEELAYAVQQLLADIANTIKNGISGSLKRDEAKKVTDWASQYGVKVDFNETAEGLQITNNSARELYNTINAIDRLQGQVVFEALKDNLIKTDERFQSASANAAYIAKLERDITKEITKKNNNDKFDDTKINQYKKELELAQKINETRGLTEDSSFKFMEQDIPSGQKNPLNYWSNWGKAFTVMNESRTDGTMAYEDFRNVITEMGNLVDITKDAIQLGDQTLHNSQEAASLIEAAAGALEVQTDGSLKVNLKKIGVEFQTGSESMTNGIDKGIQEIANSQIEMLNSLIGLLEVIVQMEQLSDLDLDSDMQLDLSEIFNDDITDFNGDWKSALTKWRDMMTEGTDTFNEDFKRGMESIKFTINGELVSLAQVIGADFNKLDNLHISPQLYQAIMNGLYESVRSGDFSEENVKELIMQNLQKHLSELTDEPIVFDMGNYTFIGSGNASFDIDWTADNTKKALEWIDDSIENKKQYLIDAFAARGKGEANTTQLQATLITDGVLTIKNNKPTVILKDYNGRSQAFTSDDAQYAEALQAKMLEQVGAKEIKLGTIGSSAAVGELNVGQAILTVRSFQGQIQYLSEETNQWYPTLSDLIAAEAGDNEEAKEQLEIKYGLKVVPVIEVDENQYRQATEKQIQEIQSAIQSRDLGQVKELAAQIGVKINTADTKATAAEWKEIEKQFDIETKTVTLKGDTEDAETKVDNVQEKLDKLIENKDQTISIEMHATNYGTTVSALNTINDQLREIAANRNQQINITTVKTTVENESKKPSNKKSLPNNNAQYTKDAGATGNVALSKGTLMGELGPELVVSKGRYYIVGQNGPEFVDLEEDAIVFNHLQTKSLLQRGITFGRGAPVTNERNAVAFAGGNITGPAMASASSILSILKELRAMWQSLLKSSTKDLAGLGGSGRGGGGGKNSNADNAAKAGEFTKELEKWYNWLQKISILGKKLNYEEKLRSKIASDMYSHGQDYTASQLKSLDYLQSQIAVEKSLVASQKEYFEKRRKELNESPMGALYTFDEYGQLKYNNGTFGAFAKLLETDKNNKPTFSAKDQYEILVEAGYGDYMKYNQSGEEITKETETNSSGETVEKADQSAYYKNAVQAFWDKVDSDKNEMQSLRDSIEQYEAEILEKMTEANEIMKEIEDNQISVEEKVLKAIEDIREREIEELQSTRDAMEEAANELISGLSDQLSKEKDMYAQQESQDELTKLQRQLAILQRSGGSASQIAGLQKEITLKQRDAYFEAQQRQIDALQAASNAELERLDNQIELMNETLAYQKLHGLLWEEVYQVLQGTPEEITDYIIQNTREYWGESPTKLTQDTRGILTEVQRFTAFRDTVKNGMDELINKFSDKTLEEMAYEETRRMNTEIEEGNAELSAGAQRIVDAINAKEISLNQVINNYETPASTPASSGDTGSGTGTVATQPATSEDNQPRTKIVYEFDGKQYDTKEAALEARTMLINTYKNMYESSQRAGMYDTANVGQQNMNKYLSMYPIPKKVTYDRGGMVEQTGPAILHAKESVLTSEQTSILRNDILSNKPTSLLSLLTDFRDAYNSIPNASAYSTVNNGGVTIENATVEMNVSKISNDYDAQRAGEQALEKMMQIARKTSAQNRIGR